MSTRRRRSKPWTAPSRSCRNSGRAITSNTGSLFVALDIATGRVIGKCYPRHRAVEFGKFLTVINAVVPRDLEIHPVLDNCRTHKTAMIHGWLAMHPRLHLHFTRRRVPRGSVN